MRAPSWILLLLLLAPSAAAYRDCFLGSAACAEYDWKVNDLYAHVETGSGDAGVGQRGNGDMRGTYVYAFTGRGWLAVHEGEWEMEERTLVTAGVGSDTRLVYFYMDERAVRYPGAYHCIAIGPAPTYSRCGTGLP